MIKINAIAVIIRAATQVISTYVLMHYFSIDEYSKYAEALLYYTTLAGITELGVSTYIIRNKKINRRIAYSIINKTTLFMILVLLLIISYIYCIHRIEVNQIVTIGLLAILTSVATNTRAIVEANNKLIETAKIDIVISVMSVILVVLFVKMSVGYELLYASVFMQQIILLIGVQRILKNEVYNTNAEIKKSQNANQEKNNGLFKQIIVQSSINVLGVANRTVDSWIAKNLFTSSEFAQYAIIKNIATQTYSIAIPLLGKFFFILQSSAVQNNKINNLNNLIKRLMKYGSIYYLGIGLCLYILCKYGLHGKYSESIKYIIPVIMINFLKTVLLPYASTLKSSKYYRLELYWDGANFLVVILLSLLVNTGISFVIFLYLLSVYYFITFLIFKNLLK